MNGDEHDETPPDTLYHYTTQAGLLGIVAVGAMYATKIQYFNDSAEFHLALNLAQALIRELSADGGVKLPDADITRLVNEVESIRHANVFALSLSAEGDLLSQWRAYGSPGSSFAVGLETPLLRHFAEEEGWALLRCIYDPEDHRHAVGAVVERAVSSADSVQAGDVLRGSLLSLAPRMKHHSFEEEEEWRLVSPLLDESEAFEYRTGRSTPIPYVQFPIARDKRESAIGEIVVGPSPHRDLSIMATAGLLRRYGIAAPVRASETTFREW
jgi:hypothetical protein